MGKSPAAPPPLRLRSEKTIQRALFIVKSDFEKPVAIESPCSNPDIQIIFDRARPRRPKSGLIRKYHTRILQTHRSTHATTGGRKRGVRSQIFSGNANRPLAKDISRALDTRLAEATVTGFSGGETHVQIDENVRGCDVFIIQPICTNKEKGISPNDALMELLVLIDAARRASARRITAVVPYYGYARQDRKDRPRVPITAKLIANMIYTAGARRVLTLDLHANQIQGFFDIPVDHLYSINILGEYFKRKKSRRPRRCRARCRRHQNGACVCRIARRAIGDCG